MHFMLHVLRMLFALQTFMGYSSGNCYVGNTFPHGQKKKKKKNRDQELQISDQRIECSMVPSNRGPLTGQLPPSGFAGEPELSHSRFLRPGRPDRVWSSTGCEEKVSSRIHNVECRIRYGIQSSTVILTRESQRSEPRRPQDVAVWDTRPPSRLV